MANSNLEETSWQQGADPRGYFNNVFKPIVALQSDMVDAVETYFEILTKNRTSAKVLASAVIYTAKNQGLDPLELVKEFQKMGAGQLNDALAAYLNLNRIPTSLIGTLNKPTPNQFVERAILL
jgi:hypothetical protein